MSMGSRVWGQRSPWPALSMRTCTHEWGSLYQPPEWGCNLGMQPLLLSVCMNALCASGSCVASHVYMLCVRVLWACAFWEDTVSPAPGWTWGHADAAALPISGHRTHHHIFSPSKVFFLNYYYLCGNCWHYSIPQMHFIIYSISQRDLCTTNYCFSTLPSQVHSHL